MKQESCAVLEDENGGNGHQAKIITFNPFATEQRELSPLERLAARTAQKDVTESFRPVNESVIQASIDQAVSSYLEQDPVTGEINNIKAKLDTIIKAQRIYQESLVKRREDRFNDYRNQYAQKNPITANQAIAFQEEYYRSLDVLNKSNYRGKHYQAFINLVMQMGQIAENYYRVNTERAERRRFRALRNYASVCNSSTLNMQRAIDTINGLLRLVGEERVQTSHNYRAVYEYSGARESERRGEPYIPFEPIRTLIAQNHCRNTLENMKEDLQNRSSLYERTKRAVGSLFRGLFSTREVRYSR